MLLSRAWLPCDIECSSRLRHSVPGAMRRTTQTRKGSAPNNVQQTAFYSPNTPGDTPSPPCDERPSERRFPPSTEHTGGFPRRPRRDLSGGKSLSFTASPPYTNNPARAHEDTSHRDNTLPSPEGNPSWHTDSHSLEHRASLTSRVSTNSHVRNVRQEQKNEQLKCANLLYSDLQALKSGTQTDVTCPLSKHPSPFPYHGCSCRKSGDKTCIIKLQVEADLRDYVQRLRLNCGETPGEKKAYVLRMLHDSIIPGNDGGSELKSVRLPNAATPVCRNCFALLLRIPCRTMSGWCKAALQGNDGSAVCLTKEQRTSREVTEKLLAYIEVHIVQAYGEPHPRKDEIMLDKVPVSQLLEQAKQYADDNPDAFGGAVTTVTNPQKEGAAPSTTKAFGRSTFYRVWAYRLSCPNNTHPDLKRVAFWRFKGVSSKCFACSRLERQAQKIREQGRTSGVSVKNQLKDIEKERAKHRAFFKGERMQQHYRVCVALDDYEGSCSLVMDGMDSKKTVCPMYAGKQGELEGLYKNFLKVKFTGVMIHGYNLNIYPSMPWVRTGANLAATALVHTLSKWQNDLHLQGRELPADMYLLTDGGSENINHTMMALFGWLVSHRVFANIYVARLPVGHTHNDLDQRWSVVAQHLATIDSPTLDHLLQATREAFNGDYNTAQLSAEDEQEYVVQGGKPIIRQLPCNRDYDAYFSKVANSEMEGFGSCYRLIKDASGQLQKHEVRSAEVMYMRYFLDKNSTVASMTYKTAAQYQTWHGSTNGPIKVFNDAVKTVEDLPALNEVPQLDPFTFTHANDLREPKVIKGFCKGHVPPESCMYSLTLCC